MQTATNNWWAQPWEILLVEYRKYIGALHPLQLAHELYWEQSKTNSYLGLHGVTDGDVPLDGEGGQGERRGVHGEELGVDHEGAARAAPEPHVAQDVIRENLIIIILY